MYSPPLSVRKQHIELLTSFSTNEEDQTYKRKVQEIWLAIQLEQDYSKQEIFEFYINKVYYNIIYYYYNVNFNLSLYF